jgi:hypothetical protein
VDMQEYDYSLDMWSLGCMFAGMVSFHGQSQGCCEICCCVRMTWPCAASLMGMSEMLLKTCAESCDTGTRRCTHGL